MPAGVEKTRQKGAQVSVAEGDPQLRRGPSDEPRNDGCEERPEATLTKPPLIQALTNYQQCALKALKSTPAPTALLHGITGSGKTNIYLHLAKEQFALGNSTILLVPEIALTTQLVQIFTAAFPGSVLVLHSKLTEAERHLAWLQILNSTNPLIIIGPRSALFAPVHNLGLIIIDEAHESAYSQENPPKYSTLRLASFIASQIKVPCLLGTATPLATDYYLAKQKHSLVELNQKALKTKDPDIKIINLKDRTAFTKNRYFSDLLLAKIQRNLENHHQTLIFHNRRGSAPLTLCENCGWQALCPTCFLPLTLHSDTFELICHTCGHHQKVPTSCPDCHHSGIIHKGFGTQLLENELNKLFKNAKIARFDGDNKKSDSLENLYNEVKNGDFDIIIGTQSIARGLDLPNLATVGVVQADAGLSLPDYSAEERTFHLLTQVIGRVGRGHLDTAEAIIQTYQPDHPVITTATKSDYSTFINYLLKKRQKQFLPPFSYLAKLTVTYKTEQTTLKHIQSLYKTLQNFSNTHQKSSKAQSLLLSPPTPAFHERTRRGFTWQITLRSTSRKIILNTIKKLPQNSHYHFTLDPPSLL